MLDIWPAVDRKLARSAFHRFLFLRPGNLSERLLLSDPDAYPDDTLRQMIRSLERRHPIALAG